METRALPSGSGTTATATAKLRKQVDKKNYSVFEIASDFFDSCRILESPTSTLSDVFFATPALKTVDEAAPEALEEKKNDAVHKFSCNYTCEVDFDSLEDQRSHFKSDFHRYNVKRRIVGKDPVKEEDFNESAFDSLFKDDDMSSISGSDDEDDKESVLRHDVYKKLGQSLKNKVFVQLQTGEKFSIWKCLLLDESVKISFKNDESVPMGDDGKPCLTEREVTEKLRYLIHEPRDSTHLRVLLLARGGHFAGCVFDGNTVVAHKTFHRYVIRAKAGKKQSSKDSSGKIAHSAGASIRRYNELALKKDIRELLGTWKPYFDAASCVFIHAPSDNRQLLFDGEKSYFSCQRCAVRNIPLTVRRPTLKEARRLYNALTQISFEVDEEAATIVEEDSRLSTNGMTEHLTGSSKEKLVDSLGSRGSTETTLDIKKLENVSISGESESEKTSTSTPLHEAAKSGSCDKVMELLEEGQDPCIKDERGRTPYMLATDKDVRNTFRRFMASNLDKWDWLAAKVPSPLTKEMEESQAAKQAEKDAKRKARAKELKKLRKAKEKKAQAEAAQVSASISSSTTREQISKEEQLRREQVAEREKRAAAAERRMASLQAPPPVTAPSSSQPNTLSGGINCSCCHSSLAGKVPFHRYNYKYCSTSCMHVHREILEDG